MNAPSILPVEARGKTPPQYNKKFDRKILQKLAEQYYGSLVGEVAAKRLQEISDSQVGTP